MLPSNPLLVLLSLLSFASVAFAGYDDPVGIWDMTGKRTLRAEFSGITLPARKLELLGTIQFHDDGRLTSTLMSAVGEGRWRAGKRNGYRISYDVEQIRGGAVPYLSYYLADQFTQLGKYFSTEFSVRDVRIKSYTDTGTLKKQGLEIKGRLRVVARVDFEVKGGKKPAHSRVEFLLHYTGQRFSAPSKCCSSEDPAQNLADSQAFLRENALLPGVLQTASGLQYRVIQDGSGASPGPADEVTVNYRGTLPSGETFDANANVSFALNRVIAGWTEGLQLMRNEAYYRFYVPPELAYGEFGGGATIKPNTALVFDVQLLKVGR